MKLVELIDGLKGAVLSGSGEVEIGQIEYDSRAIREAALFFAVKGYKVDGYGYAQQAIDKGAVAVMGERSEFPGASAHVQVPDMREAMAFVSAKFYGFPGERIKACGVTGTNGKTTTCFLIKRMLEERGKTTGLVTSVVYDTGKDKFDADRTTPESLDMQRLLFLMKKNFCVNAVIEVSSHALMLHRVDHINFRVAVYTNLTRDHLDFHGTMDEYFNAKRLLAKRIDGPLSYVVFNLDQSEFRQLIADTDSPFMTFSLENPKADVYAEAYELRHDGTFFDLVTPMGRQTVRLQLLGRFNLINAIGAAAGGLACGVDLDSVVRGLETTAPVPGRLNYIAMGQPFAVYVDYAHTPDAIARLIDAAREINHGRVLMLFGCGGDRDKGKRPLMGEAATTHADYVVVTSDNPRTEDPLAIIADIKPGLKGDRFEIEPDRRAAIVKILSLAKADDVVLLAGKGSEPYQEINGHKHPFVEIDVAREVLAQMGYHATAVTEEH